MTEREINFAANYYVKNRKALTEQNRRAWTYLTDLNIALLERTAEAYGLSVQALAEKVAEIDRRLAERLAAASTEVKH
jgi:hypothetical protein